MTIELIFQPDQTCLIKAAGLWTEPGDMSGPAWVLIRNGLIAETGSDNFPHVPEAEVHELGAVSLFPGFIDAHVHLGLFKGANLTGQVDGALSAGICGLRDAGDRDGRALKEKREISARMVITATGQALHRTGRYGSFLGRPISGQSELDTAVKDLKKNGAGQIKVIASGPVDLEEFGRCGPPQFTLRELTALVECAGNHGLKVMAHANGPSAARSAVQAGAVSVEHGYFMGRENLELMAGKGTFWIPTVTPLAIFLEKPGLTSGKPEVIRRIIDNQLEQMSLARELGVRMGLGTDTGSPGLSLGSSLRSEMSWMLKAGYGALEVLTAVTAGNAELIEQAGRIGRLIPGHPAFLTGFSNDRPLSEAVQHPPAFVGRPAIIIN